MSDADNTATDTPGTDQEKVNEDARLVGNEPNEEAIDEPTQDSEQEAEETYWMVKEMVAVGLVSIVGISLLTFGLMQATGMVDIAGAIGDWILFVGLAVLVVAAFVWSQWRT
ncbi:cell division protein CrgA [Natrialbaceae archaeon GCM10025810]|uniref:cell division protein CrgA n=1 Tax=Halovalidus salilacus TaxID=3075124 RepID=UPI003619882E